MPEQMTEDELARADRISRLYPQPSTDKRSFTHFTPDAPEPVTTQSAHISWLQLATAGVLMALPFIIFEIGITALTGTTSTTEAAQFGMLATIYLLFTTSLAWLAYKYFIKIIPVTSISPSMAYGMVLLFSIPTVFLLKDPIASITPSFSYSMISYSLALCIVFIGAILVIISLTQRQNKHASTNLKPVAIFLALPYIAGLVAALIKMLDN
jgi:hypothetical protein